MHGLFDAVRDGNICLMYKLFLFVSSAKLKTKGIVHEAGRDRRIFEDSLCCQWNFGHDWMDFFNWPLFLRAPGSGEGRTHRTRNSFPALFPIIEPVESKAPPLSFDSADNTPRLTVSMSPTRRDCTFTGEPLPAAMLPPRSTQLKGNQLPTICGHGIAAGFG
jgi:hypothetical protein